MPTTTWCKPRELKVNGKVTDDHILLVGSQRECGSRNRCLLQTSVPEVVIIQHAWSSTWW